MPDHENDIATYLTLDGKVFIAPQFNVAFDKELNEGGSCLDFVALDLGRREVVIVEVTMAVDLKPIISRVSQREQRWYRPIRKALPEVVEEWGIRLLGFVRKPNVVKARQAFPDQPDVAFHAIEDATFLWEYWDRRMAEGLPR